MKIKKKVLFIIILLALYAADCAIALGIAHSGILADWLTNISSSCWCSRIYYISVAGIDGSRITDSCGVTDV